jgi:hypothetical protein
MHPINWSELKEHFTDYAALIDIFYRRINPARWRQILEWLQKHPHITMVNWYDPKSNVNYDKITDDIYKSFELPEFYIFATLQFDKMELVVRRYIPDEVECDISPDAIKSETDFGFLIKILDEIAALCQVANYTIQPEASDFVIYQRVLP